MASKIYAKGHTRNSNKNISSSRRGIQISGISCIPCGTCSLRIPSAVALLLVWAAKSMTRTPAEFRLKIASSETSQIDYGQYFMYQPTVAERSALFNHSHSCNKLDFALLLMCGRHVSYIQHTLKERALQ